MELGESIYRLRTEKNLSQGDLANALDVSRQSVSKWENNSAVPELDKLIRMAQIFGITIDELVTGSETRKAEKQVQSDADPQPQPISNAPEKRGMPAQQILGILLTVFGGLCMIVFTVVGIFVGMWLLGLAIAMPFLLCGVICLLCRKNVGLTCAWAIYVCLWLLVTVCMAR